MSTEPNDKDELKSKCTRVENVIYLPKRNVTEISSIAEGEITQGSCVDGVCSINWKPKRPAA